MRVLVALALVMLAPCVARADAYAWGGTRGRVSISVTLTGFHDGAGASGWDVEHARWLAAWATRIDAMLPPGTRAEIDSSEPDGELTLTLRHPDATVETLALGIATVMPGDRALDVVLDVLARRFHVPIPAAPVAPRVYTVQLLAASAAHVAAFLQHIDSRIAASEPDFFWETCVPCAGPIAHVLDDAGPVRRVVVGVYADRAAAERAARELRARHFSAFVRPL